MLYERIYAEYQNIEEQIDLLDAQIKKLPRGSLICTKNGKYFKYYLREGTNLTYLKKEQQETLKALALKKYLSLQLEDLLHEKAALSRYLRHHNSREDKAACLLSDDSAYRPLLSSHFISYPDAFKEWVHAPYERNKKNPEQLLHKTISGNVVRSKSEALIDMALYQNHIPYRYEASLLLNDVTIFPDFTILHPKTGRQMYWEHFGMMDNPNYSRNACSKLQLYCLNHLIPSIDLITTYETSDTPLTSDLIQKIITYYFL